VPEGAGYAVWGTLDSLNDTGISPKTLIIAAHWPFLQVSRSFAAARDRKLQMVPVSSNFT
jgi:hypothetical protein